jgi:hypothetical protein
MTDEEFLTKEDKIMWWVIILLTVGYTVASVIFRGAVWVMCLLFIALSTIPLFISHIILEGFAEVKVKFKVLFIIYLIGLIILTIFPILDTISKYWLLYYVASFIVISIIIYIIVTCKKSIEKRGFVGFIKNFLKKFSLYTTLLFLYLLWLIGLPIAYMWILIKLGHALNLDAASVTFIFYVTLPSVWALVAGVVWTSWEEFRKEFGWKWRIESWVRKKTEKLFKSKNLKK